MYDFHRYFNMSEPMSTSYWLTYCLLAIICSVLILLRRKPREKRVIVVVLGDIGRSPRMQYHCLSFSKAGFQVDLVGYGGSVPHEDLVEDENIHLHHMIESPESLRRLPRMLVFIGKAVYQSLVLVWYLLWLPPASYILVQNPPAIPSLAVCWVVCIVRGWRLIVDWHNYGYTILGLSLGSRHPLVRVAKLYERCFGRLASGGLCVTKAMKEDLMSNWGIRTTTVYDRPPDMFRDYEVADQHRLFMKLAKDYPAFGSGASDVPKPFTEVTAFTLRSRHGEIVRLDNRPALLVSSTSWTEDEDFSILMEALERYEKCKEEDLVPGLPELVCAITGKGPLKQYYSSKLAQRHWKHIQVCTPWLEAADYPKLLGSADLGVCLHTSSSGLDLPMKVVDMFGCGLPVCAIHFKCLHELVQHEKNGMVFRTESELAQQIQDLLAGFPDKCSTLKTFRQNLRTFQKSRWDSNWQEHVAPLFTCTS